MAYLAGEGGTERFGQRGVAEDMVVRDMLHEGRIAQHPRLLLKEGKRPVHQLGHGVKIYALHQHRCVVCAEERVHAGVIGRTARGRRCWRQQHDVHQKSVHLGKRLTTTTH